MTDLQPPHNCQTGVWYDIEHNPLPAYYQVVSMRRALFQLYVIGAVARRIYFQMAKDR